MPAFLSLGFLDAAVDSLDALWSGVEHTCPDRLAELEALVKAQWLDVAER